MKTVMSVKIDPEIKLRAQEVAASIGISLSTLINAYLRQIVATRRVELHAPEPMTPKLEKLIREVEKERQRGEASRAFDDVENFIAALRK